MTEVIRQVTNTVTLSSSGPKGDKGDSYVFEPSLRTFWGKAANAASSPVDLMFIGDSITEDIKNTTYTLKWPYLLTQDISRYWLGHGDIGFFIPIDDTFYYPQWTTSGTVTPTDTLGIGGRGAVVNASAYVEIEMDDIDAIQVVYSVSNLGGSAPMVVSIDGSPQTAVQTYDSALPLLGAYPGRMVQYEFTRGTHTIKIENTSGSIPIILEGVMFHRGTLNSGFRCWNAGHAGWPTTAVSYAVRQALFHSMAQVDPDLEIWAYGFNDYAFALSPTTVVESTKTIFDYFDEQWPTGHGNLIVGMYSGADRGDLWEPYRQASIQIANDQEYARVDLHDLFGYIGPATYYGPFSDDGTHPNSVGSKIMKDAVYAALHPFGAPVALEDQAYVPINAQTGTTYTLTADDAGYLVTLDNGSAITLTVPPDSDVSFPAGTRISLMQKGAGTVTVSPGSGVTIVSFDSLTDLYGEGAGAELIKIGTDTWWLTGLLT